MIYEYSYNGITIPVPEQYDRVGIAMSGGMDSTLLAAMLAPLVDWSKVTVYTVDQKNSVNTVKKILHVLGIDDVDHRIITDPKNANGALSPIFLAICGKVDYFYTGITKNPLWADGIPDGQKPHRFNKVRYQNMFMPFGLTDKKGIVDTYYRLEYDQLISATHTCTERPQGKKSCGLCFACRERKWAFQELQYPDPAYYE